MKKNLHWHWQSNLGQEVERVYSYNLQPTRHPGATAHTGLYQMSSQPKQTIHQENRTSVILTVQFTSWSYYLVVAAFHQVLLNGDWMFNVDVLLYFLRWQQLQLLSHTTVLCIPQTKPTLTHNTNTQWHYTHAYIQCDDGHGRQHDGSIITDMYVCGRIIWCWSCRYTLECRSYMQVSACVPVAQPTVSKHGREKYHIPWTCLPQAHLGVFQLWPLNSSWLPWGGLTCILSNVWCHNATHTHARLINNVMTSPRMVCLPSDCQP